MAWRLPLSLRYGPSVSIGDRLCSAPGKLAPTPSRVVGGYADNVRDVMMAEFVRRRAEAKSVFSNTSSVLQAASEAERGRSRKSRATRVPGHAKMKTGPLLSLSLISSSQSPGNFPPPAGKKHKFEKVFLRQFVSSGTLTAQTQLGALAGPFEDTDEDGGRTKVGSLDPRGRSRDVCALADLQGF